MQHTRRRMPGRARRGDTSAVECSKGPCPGVAVRIRTLSETAAARPTLSVGSEAFVCGGVLKQRKARLIACPIIFSVGDGMDSSFAARRRHSRQTADGHGCWRALHLACAGDDVTHVGRCEVVCPKGRRRVVGALIAFVCDNMAFVMQGEAEWKLYLQPPACAKTCSR